MALRRFFSRKKRTYFRIKITFTGWLFLALCIAIGFAALNTGNNLLYLIFAMMLSFLVLSGILSNNTLSNIHLNARYPSRIFARQNIRTKIHIQNNKKWFPSFAVVIQAKSKNIDHIQSSFIVKIPPESSRETKTSFQFSKRGYQNLPSYQLETTYPFGLVKKFIDARSAHKSLIYPELFPIKSILNIQSMNIGQRLSRKKGDSGNPYGIRDFVYGDHYRYIHWKSSAKSQNLRIKEFETEKRNKVNIQLKLLPNDKTEEKWRELAVSATASLIQAFSDQNFRINLQINDQTIKNPKEQVDMYFAALALAEPAKLGESRHLTHVKENFSSVLVTDAKQCMDPLQDILITRDELNQLEQAQYEI